MQKSTYYIIGIIVVIAVLFLFLKGKTTGSTINIPGQYDEFAQCLAEKEVKMYGAFWCPHCQKQKDLFKESFKYVNYTECSTPDGKAQTTECKEAGIDSYPTWEFSDKKRVAGELSLEKLGEISGCELK